MGLEPASKLRKSITYLGRKRMASLQPTNSSVDLLAYERPTSRNEAMNGSAPTVASTSPVKEVQEDVVEPREEEEGRLEASIAESEAGSEQEQEGAMSSEAGPIQEGKRVKVGASSHL